MNRKNNVQETISFSKPGGNIQSIKVKNLVGKTVNQLEGTLKHDILYFFMYGKISDIENFLKKYGSNVDLGHIFNNFFTKLPGGYRRTDPLYQEILRNYSPRLDKENKSLHSPLYMASNPMIFHEAIDTAIVKCGMSIKEITKLNQSVQENKEDSAVNVLYQRLTSVYIFLRKKGYSHQDFFS